MSLKRNDLIFGLHFDFHANENSPAIGENFTEESVQEIIDAVKPQFIQCDCKGHHGVSSYPTGVGYPAPVIKKDILKMWRNVTKRNGIPLFVHYSGLFDGEAVKHHPEWGVLTENGDLHPMAIKLTSEYADELMIPQLCELAGKYQIDGAWVDGDCWGVLRDQGEAVKEKFTECSGIERLPVKRGDEGFDLYLEILRNQYREYLKKYVDSVHKKYPDFQIASNWAFSTYMPEEVTANVDFLSGDVHGSDTLDLARYEAKYLSQQGKPWDLMPWGTSKAETETTGTGDANYGATKSNIQLKQEAAEILAHGGGFQVYYTQNPDGSVNSEKVKIAQGLSEFCMSRKPYCFHGKQISEIAVLYSTKSAYRMANEAFGFLDGTLNFLKGNVSLMSSLGVPFDFVSEHNLFDNIDRYSLIVVPEWDDVFEKAELVSFVEKGGNLLVIGSKATESFAGELGMKVDSIKNNVKIRLRSNLISSEIGMNTDVSIINADDSRVIEYLDICGEDEICRTVGSSVSDYGKGRIGGIYFDTGLLFKKTKDIVLSDFFKKTVNELLPCKKAEVLGSRYVDIVMSEVGGNICINLINTAGPHSDPTVMSYDEIPCITDITVRVRCDAPKSVYKEPEHKNMYFKYENGILEIKIDKLVIYDIYVINF